jgi:hypothetical protein
VKPIVATIYFPNASAQITPALGASDAIIQIARDMAAHKLTHVILTSFTNRYGNASYNKFLGHRRIATSLAYLTYYVKLFGGPAFTMTTRYVALHGVGSEAKDRKVTLTIIP